jgi:hypothetical protein
VERNATTEADLRQVFASLKKSEVDGVAIVSPNLITRFPSLILRLSSERRLPLGSHRKAMSHEGALFSYGPIIPRWGARLLSTWIGYSRVPSRRIFPPNKHQGLSSSSTSRPPRPSA